MTGKKIMAVLLAGSMLASTAGCSRIIPSVSASGESEEQCSADRNRLEAVQREGKLVIGVSPDYAPFAFEVKETIDGVSCAGADIALGRYIAEKLGVEAEFCQMEFEDCLAAVAEGSVDLVLLGMLPEEIRGNMMDFTDIYYQPGDQVLLVKSSQGSRWKSLEDLEGKTVAAQYGSLQAQLVTEQLPESFMELTDDVAEEILMLRVGSVDGAAMERELAEDAVEEHDDLEIAPVRLSYEQPEGVVGGVVKGETELLEEVNAILAEVSEQHLYLNWLDEANRQAMEQQSAIR